MAFTRRGDIGEWGPFRASTLRAGISASGITAGSGFQIVPMTIDKFKVIAIYD